jgi:hypothetical protein
MSGVRWSWTEDYVQNENNEIPNPENNVAIPVGACVLKTLGPRLRTTRNLQQIDEGIGREGRQGQCATLYWFGT